MSFTSAARRDLSLVVVAKSVSLLGDQVAALALTLRLQAHGAGTVAVAGLLVAALVPLVVLAPLVGRLVDGHDSRLLLVSSSLAQAALCAVLAFQTATAPTLALVAALGCGQAVNGATWQALLPGIVGREGLPRAMGLNQAGMTAASIAAPALAGLLFATYGARVPLLLDASTFLAITVAALLVTTRHGRASSAAGPDGRARAVRSAAGLRILRADPLLRTLLLLLAVFVGLGSMVNVVDVFLVRDTLHADATWYGVSGAVLAVGMLVAALLAGRLRGDGALARAFVASTVVLALGLLGSAAVPNVFVLIPLSALIGAANGVLNVTLGALMMGRAAAEVRGRVAAALSGVASAAQITAYAVSGALGVALTPREIFALSGALGLLAPILLGARLIRSATPVRVAAESLA
jgi:MFS family permease